METVSPAGAHAVVLFDGVCNLCNGAVNFIIDHDPEGRFVFGALQSEETQPLLQRQDVEAEAFQSIVLIEAGQLYRRSEAVLRIAARLHSLWSWARRLLAVPRPLRDAAYRWLARRRYDWLRAARQIPRAYAGTARALSLRSRSQVEDLSASNFQHSTFDIQPLSLLLLQ